MIIFKLQDKVQASNLIDSLVALKKASRSDPMLNGKSHGDGWGYVLLINNRSLTEYHSISPIYNDEYFEKLLELVNKNTESLAGIVHARKASKDMPIGLVHTHPYHYYTDQGLDVWIAFNGSATFSGDNRTDAYILGSRLVEKCSDKENSEELAGCVMREYSIMKKIISSGGNLASLILESPRRDTVSTKLLFYARYKSRKNREYYTHYLFSREGLEMVVPSSLKHLVSETLSGELRIIEEEKTILF